MEHPVEVVAADLERSDHQNAVLALTDAYATDPMGNGAPLAADKRDRLIDGLRAHPTTVILLAYVDGEAAGIATCFLGFSTFAARPLLNIHDLAVAPEHRGRGVGQQLLAGVERKARELGCSKITLEVGDRNETARGLYDRAGFVQPSGHEAGALIFYTKDLAPSSGPDVE
ncbi:MAG: GNAT family N-acetyltransferase [Actinomycetota bacterium]